MDNTDLNQDTSNKSFGYYVIPHYGLQGKHIQILLFETRSAKFHEIDMITNRTYIDFKNALSFQKSYVKPIIKALETRF